MDECPTPQAPATTTLVEGVFCSVDFFSHGDITDQLLVELGVHASNFSVEFSFSRDQTTKIADSVLHSRALSGQQTYVGAAENILPQEGQRCFIFHSRSRFCGRGPVGAPGGGLWLNPILTHRGRQADDRGGCVLAGTLLYESPNALYW